MWFLMILSWLSTCLHVCFFVLSLATGLYYLAELVEEYTVIACKVIYYLILSTLTIYIGLLIFEAFPISMVLCGIASQVFYLLLLKNFPYFNLMSPSFLSSIIFLIINHYLAFSHFSSVYYQFSHILGYFTLCLWLLPFCFFISLSANDNTLPTYMENRPLINDQNDNDVVLNYFSRRNPSKKSILSLFNYAKESLLPEKIKKSF